MDLLLLLGLLGFFGWTYWGSFRSAPRRLARKADLAKARAAASDDVVALEADIASLDTDIAGRDLDEATRQDYRRALNSYKTARLALDGARRHDDIRAVTEALEDSRYALACVRARIDGRPLPTRRTPCFFDPQHGPSVEDVDWAPTGGRTRPVPACAADAELARAKAEPDIRTMTVDGRPRPYWAAGPAYSPWAQGYFGQYESSGLLPGVLIGCMGGAWMSGWDGDSGDSGESGGAGDAGIDGVGDSGCGDFGVGDFGDFGGGDGGGGE